MCIISESLHLLFVYHIAILEKQLRYFNNLICVFPFYGNYYVALDHVRSVSTMPPICYLQISRLNWFIALKIFVPSSLVMFPSLQFSWMHYSYLADRTNLQMKEVLSHKLRHVYFGMAKRSLLNWNKVGSSWVLKAP